MFQVLIYSTSMSSKTISYSELECRSQTTKQTSTYGSANFGVSPIQTDKQMREQAVLLVEYTPLPPGKGVYKPKKMTKFFKLVYPPYPSKTTAINNLIRKYFLWEII